MIGTKFYKGGFSDKEYADCAIWCDNNNATIVERDDYYECVSIVADPVEELQSKIDLLKYNLSSTDYKAIKFAEGELTEEEYAPTREERRSWRAEINVLEEELAILKGIN